MESLRVPSFPFLDGLPGDFQLPSRAAFAADFPAMYPNVNASGVGLAFIFAATDFRLREGERLREAGSLFSRPISWWFRFSSPSIIFTLTPEFPSDVASFPC